MAGPSKVVVAQASAEGLKPVLSLFDAAMIVAGSMIGSGIFIVSADIARYVGSPAGLLAVWIVSGVMTIAGALACGELAAMMPQAGGQYVYLREAYGPLWAFLFGWTLLLVVQTGTIAAVAVAFARFAAVIWPALGAPIPLGIAHIALPSERVEAIVVIAALTAVNLRGVETGRQVQNFFTSFKILALVLIAALGLLIAPRHDALAINFGGARAFFGTRPMSIGWLSAFGAAMVGGLFSADAWASVTFTAAEVRNPRRDLPLALAFGTGLVILLYILANLSYMAELPVGGVADGAGVFARGIAHARADRVAAAAMEMVWGRAGAALTAAVVMVSTFGCANGLILTGARVIYAMARDGMFFGFAGRLNRAMVPGAALVMQGIWSAVLALSGSYSALLDYVIFTNLLFYVITVGAVFVMRATRPNQARPYRAWGYPYVPAAYIVAAIVLMVDLLIMKPRSTWPGLLIVLSGLPVYALSIRRAPD
ncbi:MAG: amino acid permease [Candidatus Binataceae bacterium]